MKHSAKVMLEVLVPIALKRSSGIVSRDVQSAKVASKDVIAGLPAKSPDGRLLSDEHSANISLTEVTFSAAGIRSAGMVSSDEQPQNVPWKPVARVFFAKSPAGSDFSDEQLTKVAVNFVFEPARESKSPTGRSSNAVQFSNVYAKEVTDVDSGNIGPSIFLSAEQLLNSSSNPLDTDVLPAKSPAGTVSIPDPLNIFLKPGDVTFVKVLKRPAGTVLRFLQFESI